jgi:hypothetical protein
MGIFFKNWNERSPLGSLLPWFCAWRGASTTTLSVPLLTHSSTRSSSAHTHTPHWPVCHIFSQHGAFCLNSWGSILLEFLDKMLYFRETFLSIVEQELRGAWLFHFLLPVCLALCKVLRWASLTLLPLRERATDNWPYCVWAPSPTLTSAPPRGRHLSSFWEHRTVTSLVRFHFLGGQPTPARPPVSSTLECLPWNEWNQLLLLLRQWSLTLWLTR